MENVKDPVTPKSTEEQNKEMLRYAIEEVWNKGNYSVLDNIISDDFIIHSLNPDQEIRGKEGVIQFFTMLRTAFPDIKFTVQDQVAEGNKVATQWIAEGTHLGNFESFPPTGNHFKVTAIDIDYIENGKFSSCWSNMDQLSMLQQLGIINPGEG